MPTQYQEINDDSVVATAEARPTIAMPFDYSWVDWNASPLRGYKRLQRHKRTHAWWWRFGVPLVGEKFNTKKQVIEEVECFLCKSDELRGTEVAEFEAEDGPSPEPESDDMWYDGSSE